MTSTPTELLRRWVAEPENTARSVLVTIFGDTILPVATSIWLAQLFRLTDVFGFNSRLVRTSLFRLAAEGWFTTERVGRQSRYSLTPLAVKESEQAALRIYQSSHPDWSGTWTVTFLAAPTLTATDIAQLAQHLRWHGFIALSNNVLASPTSSVATAQGLCDLIQPDVRLPFATLEFSDLEGLVANGFFAQSLAIDNMAKAYDEFVHAYEPLADGSLKCTSAHAFAFRTMMIHDLRRIRLSGPDIPAALLPADWIGHTAEEVAARLYVELTKNAGPALSEILETTYPEALPHRFPTH